MKCLNCGTELQDKAKFCPKCGSKVEQAPVTPAINSSQYTIDAVWPEWKINGTPIGKGSYGVVYHAIRTDNNVESHAAIKVISIPSDMSEVDSLRSEGLDFDGTKTYFKGIVDDFVSEIQLMESLKGIQNIVSVEDYKVIEKSDTIGWDIYIRMELLTPFNSYICDKTLTEEEVIKLGCDICTALEICGQRNIIHRDIKPENIFINDFGHFKLGDFGIARKLENVTGGLSSKGTYNYMAPEVVNSNEYDGRVDTYSLGIVLYRLLNNNKLPFLDNDKQLLSPNERKNAVDRRIRGEALPVPVNASPAMANLILRACAHNPNNRFATAAQMKQALMSIANGNYVIADTQLDKTTSVRQAESSYDATVSVRKAEGFAGQFNQPVVDTFGGISKKKSGKVKKAKVIAIAVLSGIVALAIALAIMFFSSSAYGVYREMNSDDFNSAVELYNDEVDGSFIQETLLNMLLKGRADEIVSDFEAEKIDYETAISELNALEKMGFEGIKEKIEQITASNNAADALEKADKYYADGDYENAITEYSKIPESDENYEAAQSKINEICPKYISSVVETATEYNNDKKYKEAVGYINTAYDILPDSADTTELDKVKNESLAFYKTDISNQVTALINESDFTGAFEVIDEAIAFDDDQYFKDLRTTTEGKYVESIKTTVQGHLKNGDYTNAKGVISQALTVLPGNSDLIKLQDDVEKETPVYFLNVCPPYQKNDDTVLHNGESSFKMGGKTYRNGITMEVWEPGSWFLSNLNGNYNELKFNLGHVDETGMTNVELAIYLDGDYYKTYTVISSNLPTNITIPVSGINQIKVVANMTDDYAGYPTIGLGNMTIK